MTTDNPDGLGGSDRTQLLQSWSTRLASLNDPGAVAELVLGECLKRLGADSGSLCVLDPDGDELEIVASAGYANDVIGAWTTFPLEADLPASVAVRTDRAVFLSSSTERDERFPVFRNTPVVDDEAIACLPLRTVDGDVVGALVLGWAEARSFTTEDEQFLDDLCVHAATALTRTTGRTQLAFLAETSARLSMSLDLDDTLRTIGDLAVPAIGDRATVFLFTDGGVDVVPVAPKTDPELDRLISQFPVDLDAEAGAGAVLRSGQPFFVAAVSDEQVEAAARSPEHLALLRRIGLGAAVILPMRARSRLIGALAVTNQRGRTMSRTDRMLAEELAARAAIAIDNAQLYAAQQRQRLAAEVAEHRIQELVSALQRSLLPPELPKIPGAELAACYLPGMAGLDVGGDFYDVFDTGGDWAMVIGDVCGKGPEAAALTAVARSTIRSVAMDLRQPGQVIRKLNEALHHQDLDERFCTIVYTRVVPSAHGMRVIVCRGGHTAPLLRRADGRIEAIGAIGPLIGVFPEIRVWEETAVLEAGDALILYTDGVTEARRDGQQLGEDRLTAAIAACDASSAESIAAAVEATVLDFCGQPTDDTAVLVLRVND